MIETNPYQSPEAELVAPDVLPISDAETIRREHMRHERAVKSISTLYFLGAIICFIALVISAYLLVSGIDPGRLFGTVFTAVLFLIMTYLGVTMRRLNPMVRIPAGLFAVIGLLYFPIGTIINGYILYLLFSKKGKMVFSPEYAEIIRQTLHVRYKSSLAMVIVLVVLLAILASAIAVIAFA